MWKTENFVRTCRLENLNGLKITKAKFWKLLQGLITCQPRSDIIMEAVLERKIQRLPYEVIVLLERFLVQLIHNIF